ncbi:MAG: TauD/TfdA family dioxygenase [Alphaproteobacteria bacterium]|nr:TauD/TfdA family dioxygenase [Alphaproteobacteria bacterium]
MATALLPDSADLHNVNEPAELPDFDAFPIRHRLTAARACGQAVDLVWDDGAETRYHVMTLKENAPDIVHPVTREQATMLTDIPADLAAAEVGVDGVGGLWVRWSTGGISRFHPGWLRAYAPGAPEDVFALPPRVTWDAATMADLPRFDGPAAIADETVRTAWMEALYVYGAAILEGLPTDEEVIHRVPSLIGPLRETNFGKTFTVESKQDATSNAYTTMALPVHTDLCTREYEPGLQFLHCIRNDADGGENILADGFRLAERIKADAPEEYDALTTVPITFYNKATDTDFRCTVPMFDLDKDGDLSDVRWSPWLRAPVRASFEETDRLYRGLRRAFALAEDPAFTVTTKLKAGDLLCFDNRRALHGRVGYDPTTGGRKLMGCYVEREDLVSALRIMLRRRRAAEV